MKTPQYGTTVAECQRCRMIDQLTNVSLRDGAWWTPFLLCQNCIDYLESLNIKTGAKNADAK